MKNTLYPKNSEPSPGNIAGKDDFKALYNVLSGKMYSLCLRYIPDDDMANEVFQQSFSNFLLNFSSLQGSYEDVARKVFVAGCLSSLEGKEINASKNSRLSYLQPLKPLAMESLQPRQQLELIRQLPQKKRIVFNMHEVEGYGHREIAEMLNISVLHSKTALFGARLFLKKMLAGKEDTLKQ